MVHNLVHNLCESLVTNIGGIADTGKRTPPVPITYLTQWRLVGNSTVHTDPYLTQWKVEGNSVVDNNTILSCGDLGQDGYYHVKISNGVNVFDIALTEPLRKVNDVADTIEFSNGSAVVTRNIGRVADISVYKYTAENINDSGFYRYMAYGQPLPNIKKPATVNVVANALCPIYDTVSAIRNYYRDVGIAISTNGFIAAYDTNYNESTDKNAFLAHIQGVELIYELETPTTETIQVSPFPISPTDTYTSANDTPYSAFEYKKNVEIWSCGEYSAVDGKYHILVQPLGGSIADIALDEPLRKVNDVADTIEFADGVATVTRNIASTAMSALNWTKAVYRNTGKYRYVVYSLRDIIKTSKNDNTPGDILCVIYNTTTANGAYATNLEGIAVDSTYGSIFLYDANYDQEGDLNAFLEHIQGAEMVYALATPTTETIQVPQIQEAESYTCVISQSGKAVSWSSFETN